MIQSFKEPLQNAPKKAQKTAQKNEKILVIGSGPIQIGQGCEFDYSGTQACLALRDEGYDVVLVNSNPATIMTDAETAARVYIEPLTLESLRKIIELEKPHAVLPTMGGQIALNLFMELHEQGDLARNNIRALGVEPRTVTLAEDRRAFRSLVTNLGLGVVRGGLVTTRSDARELADTLALPLVIRASFTLGGTGGGIAYTAEQFETLMERGFAAMPPGGELSIEESIIGWKEYELEVMRDAVGNFVVVCGIENVNPMGVHTGDSITVAPCMTLTDVEYQALREMAKKVFEAVGMKTGGANIQFAVAPDDGRVVVIEMNPRVSRSSALVSKATGYPIARISAKLALGKTLAELKNEITENTPAAFEPSIDYVAVKIPRWDFEKFPLATRDLGIQMKSVGEVLAFGRSFKDAFQKAWRSLESGLSGWEVPSRADGTILSDEDLLFRLKMPTPDLFFDIKTALERSFSVDTLHSVTGVGKWFLNELEELVATERRLQNCAVTCELSNSLLFTAKQQGFSNAQVANLSGHSETFVEAKLHEYKICPTFKMVDTCAAEFEAATPYYFKTYETQDDNRVSAKRKIVILGSGPNRIGQGVEFDYSCVHAVKAVQSAGYEAILVNSNPETVSTDFHTSDKLYMEPLYAEDVLDILRAEKPDGVLVQFGGQSPLKIAKAIEQAGFNILGSPFSTIELAENREEFGRILKELNIEAPPFGTCVSVAEGILVARRIGFPVLVRPSYVLGGRGMQVVRNEQELTHAVEAALRFSKPSQDGLEAAHPVLIDCYLDGAAEFDVDLICDRTEVYVPAIMEHIEEAGIHSGDSACLIPPHTASQKCLEQIEVASKSLALKMQIVGLMNIQFVWWREKLYVLEVNARSSRSVPFVSKATGIPMARIAALVCTGKKLAEFNLPRFSDSASSASGNSTSTSAKNGLLQRKFALKVPVFPFSKFPAVVPLLGPEMRSIGEVMSFADTLPVALAKGYMAAGFKLRAQGTVLLIADAYLADVLAPSLKILTCELGCSVLCSPTMQAALADLGIEKTTSYSNSEILLISAREAFAQSKVNLVVALEAPGATHFAPLTRVLGPLSVRAQVPFTNSVFAVSTFVQALQAAGSAQVEDIPQALSASHLSIHMSSHGSFPAEVFV